MIMSSADVLFYAASGFSLVTTAIAITRVNPVYALLNFVMSLLGVAVILYAVGGPFVAALEVIVYAGAIVVLFLFVVMMLNLSRISVPPKPHHAMISRLAAPLTLAIAFGVQMFLRMDGLSHATRPRHIITPKDIGSRLFTHDILPVELGSMLLLAALIVAYHLGRPPSEQAPR